MKALFATILLFCAPLAGPSRAEPTAPAAKFDSQGVQIHYTVEGSGEPVVLIHGLHSNAEVNWRRPGTIEALARQFRVIALDVRGHGLSDKPKEIEDYGVEMVADVVRLLDHLQLEQAHIVGYSMGGLIAMKLTVEHPERIRSLTLGGMGWLRDGSALQAFWERLPEREGAKTPSICARSLGELAVTEADLKAIRNSVAVLVGQRDPVRRLYVAPLERIRPDWPVTAIEGAGHLNCIFKPQFKEELERSLERQSRQ